MFWESSEPELRRQIQTHTHVGARRKRGYQRIMAVEN
jgi:hypothetical protein